jgi:hypothetical protein
VHQIFLNIFAIFVQVFETKKILQKSGFSGQEVSQWSTKGRFLHYGPERGPEVGQKPALGP